MAWVCVILFIPGILLAFAVPPLGIGILIVVAICFFGMGGGGSGGSDS